MDRTELWKQTFLKYKGFAVNEQVDEVISTRDLTAKLCSGTGPEDDSSQLIVASIQKMSRITIENGANPLEVQKIQAKRIVFIIDEAHQDVAGEMLAGIKRTYKNALFFGFTGTPIKLENAINGITTQGLFGECLHSYNILNGIRDKNVLGFKTFRISTFYESELREIVAKQKSGIVDINVAMDKQFNVYRTWMQKSMLEIERELDRSIYRNDESGRRHRKEVVKSILKNWDVQSNRGQFHQILATSSISEAIEYYDLFASNDKGLFVTAIFDPSTDLSGGETWKEDAIAKILTDYNNRFGFKYNLASYRNFKDDVCSRLSHIEPYKSLDVNRADAVNIVIVVNQLLTGFDSKWINVLNLDKVLVYQKYIQAASRTNRLFRQDLKPYGIIKYYRVPHLQEELANQALRLYIESDEYKYVFASSLGNNITTINRYYKDIKTLFTRIGIPNFDRIPSQEVDQMAFANAFNEIASAVSRAIPELFNWAQTTYKTEDCGDISVDIDEITFETLRKRYSELPRGEVVNPANVYEIRTYLIEQENNIDLAFLEANFQAFYKDLSNNATAQEIEKILLELRIRFAILSAEEQRIAEIILADIQSGEFDYQDGKGFMDYILEYSQRELYENIEMYATEIAETIKKLNAQFHPRGKNKVLECLQFGGNHEFWHDFPDEQEIAIYFQHCYDFAVQYIGFLQTDKNIICALTVTEPNRRNLFLYYLPVTDKWKVKAMGSDKSENGNKLQMRDGSGNPIYKTRRFITKPLLCHSEFWKQRGEEMSYSVLQERFYQSISKRYGAKREKARRYSNTLLPNRQSVLSDAPMTSTTFSKIRKEFGRNLLTKHKKYAIVYIRYTFYGGLLW